jgi:hypothetical protein
MMTEYVINIPHAKINTPAEPLYQMNCKRCTLYLDEGENTCVIYTAIWLKSFELD